MVANKKMSDGVGKKIVEALRKQSEIEIKPIPKSEDDIKIEEAFNEEDIQEEDSSLDDFLDDEEEPQPVINSNPINSTPINQNMKIMQDSFAYQPMQNHAQDSMLQDLESFEIPSNIAVLKKLIAQLPSGVSRHTGAQIIKQTMEALGISMKSVLQEAQQVQDGLNTSVNECHSSIQEYKKQIHILEKQSQSYQRQYTALNELISLFVQTGV